MRHEISIGSAFGKLTVIEQEGVSANGALMWKCCCECGSVKLYRSGRLRSGYSTGCGCSKGNNLKTHGLGKPPEYMVWWGMKNRCNRKQDKQYKNYGGRGIKVCERWENSFSSFIEDMGKRPFEKAQINRINNNGNYEPSNCEWTTQSENQKNRRVFRRKKNGTIDI
ncbi:hypothetical protein UFOVP1138_64 [uncultured Caudovirales phage]|uniref:Uncharacterized protein n=1 Tax=uncultured Caudovirales phage TaxID=2100421 RepID=A0A6J5QUP5_9CAUD|nr:hypothetical protein UFOVP975_56 [uncultured Caudovirales phage]CAB4186297.1 hypothetical protein UFOVP1138_64 [uncultured Caudovirales phage]CAB4204441.1 hypothetical protein UFOVP1394_61 [uncultured Caudovirales phage]